MITGRPINIALTQRQDKKHKTVDVCVCVFLIKNVPSYILWLIQLFEVWITFIQVSSGWATLQIQLGTLLPKNSPLVTLLYSDGSPLLQVCFRQQALDVQHHSAPGTLGRWMYTMLRIGFLLFHRDTGWQGPYSLCVSSSVLMRTLNVKIFIHSDMSTWWD